MMNLANRLYNKCMTTDAWLPNAAYFIVTRWNRLTNPDKKVRVSRDGSMIEMKRPDGSKYWTTKGTLSMAKRREIEGWHRDESTNWRALADQERKRGRGE